MLMGTPMVLPANGRGASTLSRLPLEIRLGPGQSICGGPVVVVGGDMLLFGVTDFIGGLVSHVPQVLQPLLEVGDVTAADLEAVAGARQHALLYAGPLPGLSQSRGCLFHRLDRGPLPTLSMCRLRRCGSPGGCCSPHGRSSPDDGGHVERTEPGIAEGGRQTTRPDRFAGARVGKGRLERFLELASNGVAHR